MIHVLLTILKIFGILLLVIFGILLFILLSVLFVPFRYSVSGEKHKAVYQDTGKQQEEEQQIWKAKVVVSWLAHLVHFRFRIQNGENAESTAKDSNKNSEKESKIKTDMELYLFGIPVLALKNKITANSKKSKVKTKTNTELSDVSEPSGDLTASHELDEVKSNGHSETGDSTNAQTVIETSEDKTQDESDIGQDTDLGAVSNALEEELSQSDAADTDDIIGETKAETTSNPIKKLIRTIRGIPEKIKASIEKIKLTIRNICDKIKKGSDFLKKESTKATIRLVFGKLKNIIVHILPKKLKGTLIFGFDDPALTGEILGVASIFYPKYQKSLKLVPVFEQQILEGNVQIKGRIIIAYIIWQAVKIVLDKNAKITFKNVKKLAAELK